MKRFSFLCFLLLALLPEARAQAGAVVYSLPRTTVCLTVEARREAFTAGPYAAYAQKYLGVAARTKNETIYTILSVTLTPYVEADPAVRYSISIPERSSVTFLQMCSQGLVAMADNYAGKPAAWRFASQAGNERFEGVDPQGNLGHETTTLYKAVRTDEGYERVPVTQDNVVEKSPDRKAADAAATIFSLREKRQQIATGDTDATFSGEALQAAIDELTRLEERYLTLFYGIREESVEIKHFDVTPVPGTQRYTALRISDQGLQPASVSEGKPVTLEFQAEPLQTPEAASDRSKEVLVHYRIPAITRCRVNYDGQLLMESRVPVYQLGEESTLPLNSILTK
jgi:hypothetical protein